MGTIVAVPPVRARFLRVEPDFARTQGHRHEQSGGWGLFPCLDGHLGFTTGAVPFVITAGQVRILRCVNGAFGISRPRPCRTSAPAPKSTPDRAVRRVSANPMSSCFG